MRQTIQVPKTSLHILDIVRQTPEDTTLTALLRREFEEKIAAGIPPEEIIRDALEITPDNGIGDGRHRFLAALPLKAFKTLPCIVDARLSDTAFAQELLITKLQQRRHYGQGARAYAMRHLAADAAKVGTENRAKMGGHARHGSASPTQYAKQSESLSLTAIAAKSLLSVPLLQQAMKLEAHYMVRADKLIQDWTALNADEAENYLAWEDMHPGVGMPWTNWRAQRLAELGVTNDAASIHTIPHHWREVYEDMIYNGVEGADGERHPYGLGAALKALGSCFATAGQPRSDKAPEATFFHQTLINKVKSFSTTMWAQWSTVAPDARMEVIKSLTLRITGGTDEQGKAVEPWPEDARKAVLAALKQSL